MGLLYFDTLAHFQISYKKLSGKHIDHVEKELSFEFSFNKNMLRSNRTVIASVFE